ETRCLRYVDAGHGYGFLLRSDGRAERLPVRSMPLGMPFHDGFLEGEVSLGPGDALVLYSDGLVDALPAAEGPEALTFLLDGAGCAQTIVERLIAAADLAVVASDDL